MSDDKTRYPYHAQLSVADVNRILTDRSLNRHQRFSILARWKNRLAADSHAETDPRRRSLKREIERSLILFH